MKRNKLQRVSLDDRRRRTLMMQLIRRAGEKPANTIAWYDALSDDDKRTLIIGVQLGFAEMAKSVQNLAYSVTPLLGAMVRDLELKDRGNEDENVNT
jgi:hypothetical protein